MLKTCAYMQHKGGKYPRQCGSTASWFAATIWDSTFYACSQHKGTLTRARRSGRVTPSVLLAGRIGAWRRIGACEAQGDAQSRKRYPSTSGPDSAPVRAKSTVRLVADKSTIKAADNA